MSVRKLQPLAHGALNRCFGCGQANRTGLRLKFFVDEEHTIVCPVRLAKRFEGPPGFAHGGVIAMVTGPPAFIAGCTTWLIMGPYFFRRLSGRRQGLQ